MDLLIEALMRMSAATPKEPVECEDGFKMSVQASASHYCTPRTDNSPVYLFAEIGCASERESLIMEYAEDQKNPTTTVYCNVPYKVIMAVIEKHGGMISGELPPFPE